MLGNTHNNDRTGKTPFKYRIRNYKACEYLQNTLALD